MTDALTDRLLAVPFTFPAVAGRSVFVLGLGGGCDVITALAVSERLDRDAARVVYGNTKVGDVGPVEPLTAHVVKVAGERPVPGQKVRGRGHANIDHGVPRNEHGSPWIVRLDDETAEQDLVSEIASLGFDLVLGIDAGGDSIATQGGRGHLERDQRMLDVLRRTRVPLLHVVVAPGCDGESTVAGLRASLAELLDANRYRGCFALAPMLLTLAALSTGLSEKRTPRIILSAASDQLRRTESGLQIVPRGCEPAVPASWLSHAFVFEPEPL